VRRPAISSGQRGCSIAQFRPQNRLILAPGGVAARRSAGDEANDSVTDILARMLRLSEGAIDKLYADGVVHRTEPFTEPQVAAVNP
jgi:hypothetical protein